MKAKDIAEAMREKFASALGLTMSMTIDRLANSTPVDTTHASTNWIGSVGKPFGGVVGSRENPTRAAQDAGRDRVRNYSARDFKLGREIYIRNNVFYLKFLNRGWSQQAPAEFVEKAIRGTGSNALRHIPRGFRRGVRKMLGKIARGAYKRGRKR